MEHLQAQLRELRSKQKRTLSAAAEEAGIETKWLCSLESRYPRSSSLPRMERLAVAYGVSKEEITALFSAEYRMRGYAVTTTLPEVARGFFKDGNFVVLDLETTGANPHGKDTEIIDIAIVDEDGIPLVSTLVRPSVAIPEEVTAIHGITDEMVKIVGQLAANYAREGVVHLADFIDNIHEDLKDIIDGISKKDIQDTLCK